MAVLLYFAGLQAIHVRQGKLGPAPGLSHGDQGCGERPDTNTGLFEVQPTLTSTLVWI